MAEEIESAPLEAQNSGDEVDAVDPVVGYPVVRGPHGGLGEAFERRRALRPLLGRAVGVEPVGYALHRAVCRGYGVLPSTHGSMAAAAEVLGIQRQVYVRLVQSTDPAHLIATLPELAPQLSIAIGAASVGGSSAVVCDASGLEKRVRAVAPIDLGERASRQVVSEAIERLAFAVDGTIAVTQVPSDAGWWNAIAYSEEGPGVALHNALLASVGLPAGAYGAASVLARRLGLEVRDYDRIVHRGKLPSVLQLAGRLGLAVARRVEKRRAAEWAAGPLARLVVAEVLSLPVPW